MYERRISYWQELEERDQELKRQEEEKKQLILKLCNVQKHVEVTDQNFKKMEGEHQKAVKMIQGFMERQQQMEDKIARKERKIAELEVALNVRSSSGHDNNTKATRRRDGSARKDYNVEITENPERDDSNHQVDITIYGLYSIISMFLNRHTSEK